MPRLTKIEEAIKQIDYEIAILNAAKARLQSQTPAAKPARPVLAKSENAGA